MGRKLAHHDSITAARKAFLREIRRCGDVRVACRRAGVSKTWAYEQRRTRPRFAKRWTAARAAYWQAAPNRERQRLHQLDPGNLAYFSDTDLLARLKQHERDRAHWERWVARQETKRQRTEKEQAEREAWRAANPNWRELERTARQTIAAYNARARQADMSGRIPAGGDVSSRFDVATRLRAWNEKHGTA